jgi:D-beta-D-heptose 7-phosphate kinase/D-beta-D-heptose 1-phosphate adenosyltransferase
MSPQFETMRVGLCNGCFDALHDGHRLFLAAASNHCDYLIVAVNSDASVKRLKGQGRPIYPITQRIEMLQALCSADAQAIIPFDGDVLGLIRLIKPDVLIRGHDQTAEGGHLATIVKVLRFGTQSTTSNLHAKSSLS